MLMIKYLHHYHYLFEISQKQSLNRKLECLGHGPKWMLILHKIIRVCSSHSRSLKHWNADMYDPATSNHHSRRLLATKAWRRSILCQRQLKPRHAIVNELSPACPPWPRAAPTAVSPTSPSSPAPAASRLSTAARYARPMIGKRATRQLSLQETNCSTQWSPRKSSQSSWEAWTQEESPSQWR